MDRKLDDVLLDFDKQYYQIIKNIDYYLLSINPDLSPWISGPHTNIQTLLFHYSSLRIVTDTFREIDE